MTSRAVLPLVPLLLLGSLACGRNAEERQLDAMRREIDNVRQSRDGANQRAVPSDPLDNTPVVPPAYAPAASARPPPAVVQIGGDGQRAGDDAAEADPQDTTPRPTIRVFGSARAGGGRNAW